MPSSDSRKAVNIMIRKTFVPALGVLAAVVMSALLHPAQAASPPQQEPASSLVEAERKAREQKRSQQQPAKVYTNEDIPTLKGNVSVVGIVPAPPEPDAAAMPAEESAAAEPEAPPPAQAEVKDEAYWREAFADGRKKLADDSKELDILQREFNLKQQQFYTDPMSPCASRTAART